jgi:hypothetical protein
MERDSVLSHGVSLFMKESMMERSDKFKWCVCKRCGTLVSFNPVKDIGTCTHCKQDDIALVETPYAFKLLIQELEAMGIELRLNTEELTMPVEQLEIARDQNDNEDEEDIEYFDIEEENKIERRWEDSYDESFNTPVIKGGAITSSEADNDEALEQPVKGGQDAEDDEEDYEEDYEEEDDDDEDDDDEEDDEEDDDEEEDDNGDDGANGKIRGYTQGGENEDENDNAAETFDNNQNEMKVIEIE